MWTQLNNIGPVCDKQENYVNVYIYLKNVVRPPQHNVVRQDAESRGNPKLKVGCYREPLGMTMSSLDVHQLRGYT